MSQSTKTLHEFGSVSIVGGRITNNLAFLAPMYPNGAPEAITLGTGTNTLNVTSYFSEMTGGGTNAITLPDGTTTGQMKKIQMVDNAADITVSVTNFVDGTQILFTDTGDTSLLMWNGEKWFIQELNNLLGDGSTPVSS